MREPLPDSRDLIRVSARDRIARRSAWAAKSTSVMMGGRFIVTMTEERGHRCPAELLFRGIGGADDVESLPPRLGVVTAAVWRGQKFAVGKYPDSAVVHQVADRRHSFVEPLFAFSGLRPSYPTDERVEQIGLQPLEANCP